MAHLTSNPVGTGPYKAQKLGKRQEIVLVKNESYFKGFLPSMKLWSESSRRWVPVSALVVGEVDLIPDVRLTSFSKSMAAGRLRVKGGARAGGSSSSP